MNLYFMEQALSRQSGLRAYRSNHASATRLP